MTSNFGEELEQIRQARANLQKVRAKLVRPSPATLESSAADLMMAVNHLHRMAPLLPMRDRSRMGAEHALRLEVAGLRRELLQLNALLKGAGQFYEGWARLLSSTTDDSVANYTAGGKPANPAPCESRNLVLHG